MSEINKSKLKKVKYNFDKITSQNSTDWKLVIFWIVLFEIIATIIEFIYLDNTTIYSIPLEHTITTEIILGIAVTLFVWFCIYNIIFENKKYIIRLIFLSMVCVYFIVTSDFSLQFLLKNLNPLHFFELEFGPIFIIEVLIKLIITYLLYQFIISLRNNDFISQN